MVDKPSRERLALALRRYVSGLITNDQLDDVEVDWRDRGAVAVKERAWGLYDDMYVHRATDTQSISRELRREISRWIIFLHTDQEYLWPEYSFDQIVNWPMNWITFGWWERNKARVFEEFMLAGDFSVWPFTKEQEFLHWLSRPRFFRGPLNQPQ
jgi:hypothetical protein